MLTLKKFKCSDAAQECSAPQRGVGSDENRIFWQNDNFEMYCISKLIGSRSTLLQKIFAQGKKLLGGKDSPRQLFAQDGAQSLCLWAGKAFEPLLNTALHSLMTGAHLI